MTTKDQQNLIRSLNAQYRAGTLTRNMAICIMRKAGASYWAIGKKFGMSKQAVCRICKQEAKYAQVLKGKEVKQ